MADLQPPSKPSAEQPPRTADATPPATPAGTVRARRTTRGRMPRVRVKRTRARAAWIGACVAVVILAALLIFVAQNLGSVPISFVSLHGQFPLAVALLVAAVAGVLITLILGGTRIVQLRRVARYRTHSRDERERDS
jgi:uncharacterized integral membrane protein